MHAIQEDAQLLPKGSRLSGSREAERPVPEDWNKMFHLTSENHPPVL